MDLLLSVCGRREFSSPSFILVRPASDDPSNPASNSLGKVRTWKQGYVVVDDKLDVGTTFSLFWTLREVEEQRESRAINAIVFSQEKKQGPEVPKHGKVVGTRAPATGLFPARLSH